MLLYYEKMNQWYTSIMYMIIYVWNIWCSKIRYDLFTTWNAGKLLVIRTRIQCSCHSSCMQYGSFNVAIMSEYTEF